jgi:hypothetical protein
MGYRNLVDGAVKTAFGAAKDLSVEAQFRKRLDANFNFGLRETDSMSIQFVTTKIIVTNTVKDNLKANTIRKRFLVNSNTLGSVTNFDEVDFEGHRWTLAPPISNNGFVYLMEAYREA